MTPAQIFFYTLFEAGEQTCLSRDEYGTELIAPIHQSMLDCYFSINPMHTKRCDANVTVFRNILVEFDKGTIEEQKAIIKQSEIPYTSVVFSGNKSLHVIISLKQPCLDDDEYRALVKRVYFKMGGAAVVDTKVGNPSRFSRAPYSTRRTKKGEMRCQELIELKERVDRAVLETWLGPIPEKRKETDILSPRFKGDLNKYTKHFLSFGAVEGNWNDSLFKAVCNMKRAQLSKTEIEERVEEINGYLDKRDRQTIKSAFERASRDED